VAQQTSWAGDTLHYGDLEKSEVDGADARSSDPAAALTSVIHESPAGLDPPDVAHQGDSAQSTVDGGERPQHTRRKRRRRRIKWLSTLLVVVLLVVAGLVIAYRVDRPLAQPVMPAGGRSSTVVPGAVPVHAWPAGGQAAVSIPALGYASQSGIETPVPVASLTKMATAVVVLRDRPVPSGSSGPNVIITADDAAQFGVDLANDETNIPLQAGETLTEQQLLEALLNQSANDVAYSLAVWDAGSETAFVAKMNALAASLGATHTHFVDASGFQPQSVSTAADMLRIASAGMSIPTFAGIAAMPSVSLPLVGTVQNIVTEVGTDGVVGVKSGYTGQAGGCMVLASYRTIAGRSVLVLASVLGQIEPPPVAPAPPGAPGSAPTTTTSTAPYSALEAQYPLRYAGPIVEGLLDATKATIVPVEVARSGAVVGTASTDWGGSRRSVPAVASRTAWLLGVPGQRVVSSTTPVARPAGTASMRVGSDRFTLGRQSEVVNLTATHALAEPTWWWKALHN
jgi:D-alanyl-D-alanine carboxypeptidase (penicillin-binding protein 5/6)